MNGSQNTIFNLLPGYSDVEKGLRFRVFIDRLTQYLGVEKNKLLSALPPSTKDHEPWSGSPPCVAGYFRSQEEIARFLSYLAQTAT